MDSQIDVEGRYFLKKKINYHYVLVIKYAKRFRLWYYDLFCRLDSRFEIESVTAPIALFTAAPFIVFPYLIRTYTRRV